MSASRRRLPGAASLILSCLVLGACAGQRDHFYVLTPLPDAPVAPAGGFATHVILKVAIPDTVDRRQMVIADAADRILILEHERWPAPLSDLVTQTLARDLEQRRADVWSPAAASTHRAQSRSASRSTWCDCPRIAAARRRLEAHWRIVDPATQSDQVGGESFSAAVAGPIEGDDYSPIARALSTCLATLADRLVEKLPAR